MDCQDKSRGFISKERNSGTFSYLFWVLAKMHEGLSRCIKVPPGMRVCCSLSTYRPCIDIAKSQAPATWVSRFHRRAECQLFSPCQPWQSRVSSQFDLCLLPGWDKHMWLIYDMFMDFMVAFFGSNSVCMGQCLVWESTRTYWWKQQARPPLLFWGPAGLKWSASSRSNASCPGAWRADLKSSSVRFHFACWTSGRQWQRWPPTESATSMSSVPDVVSYQHMWYFTLFHDMCHVISCCFMLFHVMTCFMSFLEMFYDISSCHVVSCYSMFWHVTSCYVMILHDVFHAVSCYFMLCHGISCYFKFVHVISCYFILVYISPCYEYFMLFHLIWSICSCYFMWVHFI